MQILHITRDLEVASGGPSRSIPQLINAISQYSLNEKNRRTVQHVAFIDRGKANTVASIQSDDIFLHPVLSPSFQAGGSATTKAVASIHAAHKIDLMHVHGLWAPSLHSAIAWARANRIPYVVSPRGMLSEWCMNHKKWKKLIGWWLYQRGDLQRASAIHATSLEEMEDVSRVGLVSPAFVLPNGVSIPDDLSAGRSLPKGSRTALCISRLHEVKGLDDLVDCWAGIRPEHWNLIIAGPSENGMREKLAKQILHRKLEAQVQLLDEVNESEKAELFSRSELFVLPSRSENFGMAIAEALSRGLPVVTTTGTPWQKVVEYNAGWIIPPNQVSLEKALRDALSQSSSELIEKGLRGQKLIADHFLWPSIAVKMVAQYKAILSARLT